MIQLVFAVKYGFDSSETVLRKTAEYRKKLLDSIDDYKRVTEAEIQEALYFPKISSISITNSISL